MVKKAKRRLSKKSIRVPKSKNILVLAFSVLVCAVIVMGWMLFRETYPATASKKSVYENRQTIVINNVEASNSLVNTLMNEKASCTDHNGQKNVVYIVREVEDYAFVKYGCDLDAHAYYRKDGNKWVGLSPTNKFYLGIPFCSALKLDKIPRKIAPTCWDGSVGKKGKSPALAVNPVK
jgi:hypothetical protein